MSRLIQIPKVVWVGGSRPWELATPCVFFSERLNEDIVVPAGYKTDFASVPRLPFVYARYGNTAVVAAIIHDWMYEHTAHKWSRKEADKVFLDVMRLINDPSMESQRLAMYFAVRAFGWLPWRRYRREV